MKKLVPVLLLLAACTPDIDLSPPPNVGIVVEFDPGAKVPVVPQPNDLAKSPTTGKIVVPPSPTDTPAQTEFNTNYLGTLTGFPQESNGQALVTGDLAPATVNPQTVLGFDLTAGAAAVPLAPVLANRAVVIPPPAGGWTRAHTYAIAFIAGPNGMKGANGDPVIGSPTWTLVSGTTPLVTCPDLKTNCMPTVDVIPSNLSDPAAQLADQTAKAIQLEQIRRGFAPLLDGLEAKGIPRSDVPIIWTFSIVDNGEMTFDPANNVIPFPNDIVRSNGKVALPNPHTGAPLTAADCQTSDPTLQIYCGLNTLDGFSTVVAPISENSETLGAAMQATIDAASLNALSVGLVKLGSAAPAAEQTDPKFTPCLNCLSSKDSSGNTPNSPQQLQWSLNAPLDEMTTYFGYVTSAVTDTTGKPVIATPVFALVRSSTPLVVNGHSAVNVLTDAQANQLEPLRAALKPAFDALEANGLPRSNVALAFPFTTQSEASTLVQLAAYPGQVPGLPDSPLTVADATAQYTAAAGGTIPIDGIAKFFSATMVTPVAVTGTGGTLDPANPQPKPVNLVIAIPKTPAPAGGYPVTIFGHDITRWRNDVLAVANSLAKAGQVVVAPDHLLHGDRSSCTGSAAATQQASDDASCANPTTMKCDEGALQGICVLRADASRAACTPGIPGDVACTTQGQGLCATDSKCQGAGAGFLTDAQGRPVISGWNDISLTNFFATRDNFRQAVIDFSQLVRVLKGTGGTSFTTQLTAANGGTAITYSTTNFNYVGSGLGGILGSLFNAVSPDTNNVVLNTTGGTLPQIILTAPSFAAQRTALLAGLASQGLQPGTPGFDQFVGITQWILDPADPVNVGYRLTHPTEVTGGPTAPNANRKAFVQFIEGDQTIPNPTTFAFLMGANRNFTPTPPNFGCTAPLFCYEFTLAGDGFDDATATPATRHGFLLVPPTGSQGVALTTKAQTQVATFIATGNLP
ncbi:Lipase-like protein [Labilithrix luteola]|uniref:Lipase-like protein n=1 Tax=Labilithrix luteola TaxID=1391654 RepID=A0A0K1PZC4_9BACT|nr:hypothetical protein [Labilithrix luteola]AKU98878.1 Lipase-like protein [Labilithrix luteola]